MIAIQIYDCDGIKLETGKKGAHAEPGATNYPPILLKDGQHIVGVKSDVVHEDKTFHHMDFEFIIE